MSCYWQVLGPPNERAIVLIHGFGASSEHWRYNAHFFANNGFRVYGIDLIGFGKSEQPSYLRVSFLNNKLWSEQVAAFIKQIVQKSQKGKAILIGNSLGGLTALTASAFHSDLVSAVVAAPLPDPTLMQSFRLDLPNWLQRLKKHIVTFLFKFLPLEFLIQFIIKTKIINAALQLAYCRSIKSDKELLRIVKQPAKRSTAARALRAMCIGMSLRKIKETAPSLLKRLKGSSPRIPMLLIWGRQDKLVPLILGKKIIKQYPWIELLIMERTGHCPHDESPDDFNQYVLNWLKINL